MSDKKLTPGDPLGGGGEPERHESGLPMPPREPARRDEPSESARPEQPTAPPREPGRFDEPSQPPRDPVWADESPRVRIESSALPPGGVTIGDPPPVRTTTGYQTPPPPGAGGAPPQAWHGGQGQLVLSGWWRRVGAAVIDGLIIGAVGFALMASLGIGFFATDSETGVIALMLAFFVGALVLVVVGFLYAPVMMAKTNGQTLGRMATGIRVVRTSGEPMTFGWAMLREIAVKGIVINVIAGSVTFGLAGLLDVLWPLWDEENRALHDFVVQTRTVRT